MNIVTPGENHYIKLNDGTQLKEVFVSDYDGKWIEIQQSEVDIEALHITERKTTGTVVRTGTVNTSYVALIIPMALYNLMLKAGKI